MTFLSSRGERLPSSPFLKNEYMHMSVATKNTDAVTSDISLLIT